MDKRIARRLPRQHSVIARTQALADGVHEAAYDGHVRRGRLVPVEFGVHRSADVRLTRKGEVLAALLRAGPRAVAVGPLVLRWMGVSSIEPDAPVGILLPNGVKIPRLRSAIPVWRTPQVPLAVFVDRVPCAPASRAVLESVRLQPRDEWLALVDQCAWRNRPARSVLARSLRGMPPGNLTTRRANAWLPLATDGTESPGERRMYAVMGPTLARRFRRQAYVTPSVRVDGLDDELLLAVEYIGRDHHHAGNRPRDQARQDVLASHGIRVLYVSGRHLDDPVAFRARIEGAIRARRAQLGLWPS